jgi:hypothetical protein
VQRFAPGACSGARWDDGGVAVRGWPDGGWQAWAPGVRAKLGEPLAWGIETLSDGSGAALDSAQHRAVTRVMQWRNEGGVR